MILTLTTLTVFMLSRYLVYAWAADRFCKKYLEITPCKEFLFVGCIFFSWLVIDHVSIFIPYIALALVFQISFTGLVVWLFQAEWEKKILVAAFFVAAVRLMGDFCGSLICCLSLIFLHTVRKIPEPFLDGWESVLGDYLCVLAAILFLFLMSGHLVSVFRGRIRKWYLIMAVPLIAVTAVMDLVDWGASHGILVRSGGNIGVYYDQIFSHVGICVFSALSMAVVGIYLFGMDRIWLEQRKSSQYHFQIAAYKMLEKQYSQSERLRHDMKNHVIALSGLLESRDWKGMERYLADMGEGGSLGMGEDTTGNRVVDAVLSQKRGRAEENHIQWECDVRIPETCHISEFDLCVLFGNLVDNALEECERIKDRDNCFIHVQGGKIKKCFLLVVKNRAEIKDVSRWMTGKAAFTKKSDPGHHGLGLLNVRDIVHKYNGEWEIETGEDIVTISVLIPFRDAG